MSHKLLWAFVMCVPLFSHLAFAGDVVKWVDENGTTHFGNAQFAPGGSGQVVALQPANGMQAPDTSILGRDGFQQPMKVVTIAKQRKSNPRGWRGHNGRIPGADRHQSSRGHK